MNLSLKVKIEGPEVLGSIDMTGMKNCPKYHKSCSNERACEIIGQCLLEHPLIKKDKSAKKQLRGKITFNQIVKMAERLMPSLNKPGKKHYHANKKI